MKKLYKAKVVAKTTVNNEPAKIGEEVEVDFDTLRNLALKGRLEPVDKVEGITFVKQENKDAAGKAAK